MRLIGPTLVILLTAACITDLRTRRIPNLLVVATAVIGTIAAVVAKSWSAGFIQAGTGFGTGLLIWLPFYALGMMGAGDVKFFAAASTFLGPRSAIEASLYTALFGGVLAFGYMLARSGVASTLIRVSQGVRQPELLRNNPSSRHRRMPYALAIAAGVVTALFFPGYIVT
jgi:prepilin peptidase CpaA